MARGALAAALPWPAAAVAQQVVSPADQEQARLRAEREAAERAARERDKAAQLPQAGPTELGPFPEEQRCFPIRLVTVEGAERNELGWVPPFADRYTGRCVGALGLDYIVRELQGEFLDRGLVTTRAGLPEQDLTTGTLRVTVVAGVVEAVQVNGRDRARAWNRAAPTGVDDVIDLRALEQGIEQLRSVPGREVTVDLRPGERLGGTVLDVKMSQPRPFATSLSVNNFAGDRVGKFQGAGQVAALGVLGFNEVVSAFYNRRVDAPGIPADSRGYGGSVSMPLGWWTFAATASANRYGQTVIGQVAPITTRGRLDRIAILAERVIYRDQTTKTSISVGLGKRWARNFINDVEIQIQRQDLTDIELRLNERKTIGGIRIDGSFGFRLGVGLFGAQEEPDDRPVALPSARYRIASADVVAQVPLGRGFIQSYRLEFHGQVSNRNLYGSDLIQVGGPYTVRGLDADTAELGRDGYYVRQELGGVIEPRFRPYALFDLGEVRNGSGIRGGAGVGLRVQRGPFVLDAFAARPVFGRNIAERKRVRFGISTAVGI